MKCHRMMLSVQLVLDDIREDGDREFIDALGAGLPKSGLIKVHTELVGWPSEFENEITS